MTGRADRLRLALDRAPEPARSQLLELLDEITRPMNAREIERALRDAGISKSQATAMAGALKAWRVAVITINPEEGDDDGRSMEEPDTRAE